MPLSIGQANITNINLNRSRVTGIRLNNNDMFHNETIKITFNTRNCSVSKQVIWVNKGATIDTPSDNTLTIRNGNNVITVTATTNTETEQYFYKWAQWIYSSSTINEDMVISAVASAVTKRVITFNKTNTIVTVDSTPVDSIRIVNGATITQDGQTLTITESAVPRTTIVVGAAAAEDTSNYYVWDKWDNITTPVKANITINVDATALPKSEFNLVGTNSLVKLSTDSSWQSSLSITALQGATVTTSSTSITINESAINRTRVIQTKAATETNRHYYKWSNFTGVPNTIPTTTTNAAVISTDYSKYLITIQGSNTSFDKTSVYAVSGATISASGKVITVVESVVNNRTTTITATPTAETNSYYYNFDGYTGVSSPLSADITITGNSTQYTKYVVTIATTNSTISPTTTTYYVVEGSTFSISGQTLTINHRFKSATTITGYAKSQTAQYTYTWSQWTGSTSSLSADRTFTATSTATVRTYQVYIEGVLTQNAYPYGTSVDLFVDEGTYTFKINSTTVGSGTCTFYPKGHSKYTTKIMGYKIANSGGSDGAYTDGWHPSRSSSSTITGQNRFTMTETEATRQFDQTGITFIRSSNDSFSAYGWSSTPTTGVTGPTDRRYDRSSWDGTVSSGDSISGNSTVEIQGDRLYLTTDTSKHWTFYYTSPTRLKMQGNDGISHEYISGGTNIYKFGELATPDIRNTTHLNLTLDYVTSGYTKNTITVGYTSDTLSGSVQTNKTLALNATYSSLDLTKPVFIDAYLQIGSSYKIATMIGWIIYEDTHDNGWINFKALSRDSDNMLCINYDSDLDGLLASTRQIHITSFIQFTAS